MSKPRALEEDAARGVGGEGGAQQVVNDAVPGDVAGGRPGMRQGRRHELPDLRGDEAGGEVIVADGMRGGGVVGAEGGAVERRAGDGEVERHRVRGGGNGQGTAPARAAECCRTRAGFRRRRVASSLLGMGVPLGSRHILQVTDARR
ncbi:MAG: hypothetical protein IPK12_19605 [Gemmatimonadetes bacterium]|nr:hypothetical protein [Gemmatimonadota bacterium]